MMIAASAPRISLGRWSKGWGDPSQLTGTPLLAHCGRKEILVGTLNNQRTAQYTID